MTIHDVAPGYRWHRTPATRFALYALAFVGAVQVCAAGVAAVAFARINRRVRHR